VVYCGHERRVPLMSARLLVLLGWIVVAAAVSLLGCESVKTASLMDLSGAADSADLRAQCLDLRTGSSYEGQVQRVTQGTGPVAPGPIPAAAYSDVSGSHVVGVWTPLKTRR